MEITSAPPGPLEQSSPSPSPSALPDPASAAGRASPGPSRRRADPQVSWQTQAGCRGQDPELFFPVGTTGPAVEQIMVAQAVCADCPVLTPCLDWAVRSGVEHGVWGGQTEQQRLEARVRSDRRRRASSRARSLRGGPR